MPPATPSDHRGPAGEVTTRTGTSDGIVVVLTGEVDAGLQPQMDAALDAVVRSGGAGGLVVDAEELTYIDSVGVSFLLRLREHTGGGRLTVLGTPPRVRTLLDLIGVTSRFDLHDRV